MNKIDYLAIIPARAGSKRIKNKNLLKINKKPLFNYTLRSALKTRKIKKIIITTNINKLLKKNSKKIFYIKRPEYLCKDDSSTESAILHALKIFNTHNEIKIQNIILLQPTSPFRNHQDITKAIKKFETGKYKSLLSVYESKFFLWTIRKKRSFLPLNYNLKKRMRGQSIKNFFIENGAIFIFKYKNFLKHKNRLFKPIGFSKMSKKNSLEIDSREDFLLAKSLKN